MCNCCALFSHLFGLLLAMPSVAPLCLLCSMAVSAECQPCLPARQMPRCLHAMIYSKLCGCLCNAADACSVALLCLRDYLDFLKCFLVRPLDGFTSRDLVRMQQVLQPLAPLLVVLPRHVVLRQLLRPGLRLYLHLLHECLREDFWKHAGTDDTGLWIHCIAEGCWWLMQSPHASSTFPLQSQ